MPSHSGAGTGAVRVGMIGAGPLARMTHQAALDLGIDLYVLADSPADPAVLAGAAHLIGSPDSLDIVTAFADRCHVLTVARDRVPTTHLQALQAAGCAVRPRAEAVAFAQDPAASRQLLELAGFTLAPHHEGRRPRPHIDAADRNERCDASRLGPIASCASAPIGARGRGSAELELLVARNPSGHTVNYPVVQVRRAHGGLELLMPAPIPEQSAHAAVRLAKSIADGIDAPGILAVRLALTNDGNLLVRRLATRPHQSRVCDCAHHRYHPVPQSPPGHPGLASRLHAHARPCGNDGYRHRASRRQ